VASNVIVAGWVADAVIAAATNAKHTAAIADVRSDATDEHIPA